jgi:ribose transport system permease protein
VNHGLAQMDEAGEPLVAGPASRERRTKGRLGRARPLIGPGALIAIIAFFGILYPGEFLTPTNLLTNVLETVSFVVIVAAAQTVVMVVGDFDLSVGGVAALATSFTAAILTTTTLSGATQEPGSVLVAVLLGLFVGLVCGVVSGVLISYLGVLAFIATLGMAQVYTSLARFRVDGQPVYGLVDNGFVAVARGTTLGLSNKIWIAGFIVCAVWFLLDQTTLGRKMYAVGGNAEAARYSGINTRLVRLAAFALCGLGAAAAGILQAASTATANTAATQPWMLQSVAGVFIGMAMFRNGRPNVPGTVLGVVLLRVLDNGLNFTGLNDYLQSTISGLAIVIAVLPPSIARLRARR